MLSVSRTHLLCLCVQQDVPSLRPKFLGHCWDLQGRGLGVCAGGQAEGLEKLGRTSGFTKPVTLTGA